jgi:shikimate kinase
LQGLVRETDVVVATGGGTPCHNNNLQFMNANGITVYLRLEQETLLHRLTDAKLKRPLIKDLTDSELYRFIEEKMLERTPYYEQARYTVESAHITNTAQRIQELIPGS